MKKSKLAVITIVIVALIIVSLYFSGLLLYVIPSGCMPVYVYVHDNLDVQGSSPQTGFGLPGSGSGSVAGMCFASIGANDIEDNKLNDAESEWVARGGICDGEITLRYSGSGCPWDSTYFTEERVPYTGIYINQYLVCEGISINEAGLPSPPNCCYSGSPRGASCEWGDPNYQSMSSPSILFTINPPINGDDCSAYGNNPQFSCPANDCNLVSGDNNVVYVGGTGAIETVVSGIRDSIEIVYYFDGGNWYSYVPDRPVNNLVTIENGNCYAFRMYNSVTWSGLVLPMVDVQIITFSVVALGALSLLILIRRFYT